MPPQPPIGAIGTSGSFFDAPATHQAAVQGSSGQGLEMFREDDLARLSGPERQMLAGLHGTGAIGGNLPPQPIGVPTSEVGVRSQLPNTNELSEDGEGFRGRLQEFEKLRAQHDAEMAGRQASPLRNKSNEQAPQMSSPTHLMEPESASEQSPGGEASRHQVEDDHGLPMPFPPPPSATPLPAPAPQRVKSNLPEQYATSSRSGTPDITPSSAAAQPPPLAPWAKDGGLESHKGPSLKEIQQAEAQKAAKAEEAAALARRALLEQEAAREREKVVLLQVYLQAARGEPRPLSILAQISDKKKTLADIQREEEARKQKAKEVASQAGPVSSVGKRYADLASKPNVISAPNPVPSANTSGWATVGAGGKVKAPTGPSSQVRPPSASKPAATIATPPSRPAVKASNSTAGPAHTEAMEEFTKWLHGQLAKGITGVTDILQMQALVDQVIVDMQEIDGLDGTRRQGANEPEATPDIPAIQVTPDSREGRQDNIQKPTSFLPAPKPTESASPQERLRYVNALSAPPRWHLESELAYAWTTVGSLVSALEIFKRLRLWAEVALCLASSAATDDQDGRGSGGEEKARAIIRWRLFNRTADANDATDPKDDHDGDDVEFDISSLKASDFYGSERSPPPPNAPRLFYGMTSTKRAAELGKSARNILHDSLVSFKRGATLADSNWRIWDNVITLAASISPNPDLEDVVLGVRNVIRIRKSEDALDLDILTLLVREATKTPVPTNIEEGKIFEPARGTIESKIVSLFENDIVSLITTNSASWALVSRLRAWRKDWTGALDAAEKAWRTAVGGVGSSLSASSGVEGQHGSWLTDADAWDAVVQRTSELVAAYENYGSRIDTIGTKWKGKARSAVRSVMGKAKDSWEDDRRWQTLADMMEDLRL
ncbi:Essential for maintenance of the cell wall protein 1 [Daldinia childiae]|uniref:Essential for maintenance of the cell wall protein 1 n=1 Tax=Daldinia childiae TaxID=326645 RepID=UPI00144759E6|nr:Essential for maintenance of the cell wall protein 1 [Daldinia childiae]KAF3065917.1 Essential for maintenance of the cell wall protein 1 [Daldinia childiae]